MNPESARVSSTEAIERFRARLIVYRDKLKPLLGDASDEVSRTRDWLSHRRAFWESELKRRRQALDEARQALFSARFSSLREVRTAEQAAVHRAEKAVLEAEARVAAMKRWATAFDQQAGPLVKQIEQLRTMAATDLTRAEEYLGRILGALDRYTVVAEKQDAAPE